jgi:hypothetical protein
MAQSLHYNEICEAVRRLLQSGVALAAEAGGSDTVSVGSNRLFAVGQSVTLTDETGQAEAHTVAELSGLTEVRLEAPVAGQFLVSKGAVLRLEPAALGELKWIGQGRPDVMPQPPETRLPCAIIAPGRMEQPPAAGTNRARRQDYRILVYYLERPAPGRASGVDLLERADTLFSLLGSDPYLGGAAWYAQVIRVEPEPAAVGKMREAGAEVVGVEVEMLVERME